jgi:hypothetical protein
MWFLALFSFFLSIVLCALSIFPGMLEQVPPRVAFVASAIYALFAIAVVAWHLLATKRRGQPRSRASVVITLCTLVITPILLTTYSPRRLVFQRYRAQFEAMLDQTPPGGDQAVAPLNADLDIYWIDQWGSDRRGGTYFRTLAGRRESFGFAYRPNAEGSPFGDACYELHHLSGDWYSFAASDEW